LHWVEVVFFLKAFSDLIYLKDFPNIKSLRDPLFSLEAVAEPLLISGNGGCDIFSSK
jgi:hypothetical protein